MHCLLGLIYTGNNETEKMKIILMIWKIYAKFNYTSNETKGIKLYRVYIFGWTHSAVHCIKSSFQWNDELDCVNWSTTTRWALLGKNPQQQLTDAPRVSRDRVLRYPRCSRGRRHGMVWFSVGVTMLPTPDLTAPTTIAAGLFAMVRHHIGRKR